MTICQQYIFLYRIPLIVGGAEEENFPRGGSSSLTPLEVRKIKQEAEKDVLFGVLCKSIYKCHYLFTNTVI